MIRCPCPICVQDRWANRLTFAAACLFAATLLYLLAPLVMAVLVALLQLR